MEVHESDGFLQVLAAAHEDSLEEAEGDVLVHEVLQLREELQFLLQWVRGVGRLSELPVETFPHDPMQISTCLLTLRHSGLLGSERTWS